MTASGTVAVLGAGGTMGLPMARHLAKSGKAVRAWNRTGEKAEPIAEDGAEVLGTAAEAATGADTILTILSDADAVVSTMEGSDGALAGAGEGAIWLQMSTIGIEGIERCATLADEHGLVLVDAPVVGTKQPAEQGKLTVLASGPEDVRERCERIEKRRSRFCAHGRSRRRRVSHVTPRARSSRWRCARREGDERQLRQAASIKDRALKIDHSGHGPRRLRASWSASIIAS